MLKIAQIHKNAFTNELHDNLVEPLIASGVRAHLIVLDFCVSASLLATFAPLVVPGGRILASLYSIAEVVFTTELWAEIQPALQRRSIPDIRNAILARASRISRSLTGAVHLEQVRQGASEKQVAEHLLLCPDDRDAISIIRYLPHIAEVLAGPAGGDAQAGHLHLLEVKQSANLGYAERAVLGPVPGLGTPFTPAMRSQVEFAFANRVLAILTSPTYGLQLPVAGLPLFGTGISLWSRLRDHREELLALAQGLPRCPTPFALWKKRNLALKLDSALAAPHLDPTTSGLISQVEPQAPADVQTIRHQLTKSGTAAVLIPIKRYLQPIDTPTNVLQILSPAPSGQW